MKLKKQPMIALLALLAVVALVFYWRVGVQDPDDMFVKRGNYRLEDGQYDEAVKEFSQALENDPGHLYARLGLAIAYMQKDDSDGAMQEFNRLVEQDEKFTAAYANRGILHDRLGNYQAALDDYRQALALNAEALEGPGFLWRFMRNIDKPPPSIAERALYLQTELEKPEAERLLRVPELDEKQRMHKKET